MKKFLSKYYIIFILVLLFSAPGLLAWYFFNYPESLSHSFTNKGQLLTKPILLNQFEISPVNLQKSAQWHLIFWTKNPCDDACLAQLEKLAKIRLALGRKLYEVDLDLLLAKDIPPPSSALTDKITNLGFQIHSFQTSMDKLPPVLIANPDNYLVMGFEKESNPADIFHDLKLLLSSPNTASRPGPGVKQ